MNRPWDTGTIIGRQKKLVKGAEANFYEVPKSWNVDKIIVTFPAYHYRRKLFLAYMREMRRRKACGEATSGMFPIVREKLIVELVKMRTALKPYTSETFNNGSR